MTHDEALTTLETAFDGEVVLDPYDAAVPLKWRAEDTLGPCGCTDYHLADCDLMTGAFDWPYGEDEDDYIGYE